MNVLLILIDGFGLGENDSTMNPLAGEYMAFWPNLFGQSLTSELGTIIDEQACFVVTDANLGIAGLPQSATGQTTILTGINAAARLGRHIQAFPGPQLTAIIEQHGIMKQLCNRGYQVTSANMYTPDYMDLVAKRKRRHSATTLTILSAGQLLRSVPEIVKEEAIYHDITNELLPLLGIANVPVTSSQVAGQRLVRLANKYDFTMYEYFMTDRIGHKQNWEQAMKVMNTLDAFLCSVYQNALSEGVTVLITSDHGNFEDFSRKTHTRNSVPTVIFGPSCCEMARKISDLSDITPTIIEVISQKAQL